MLFIHDDIAARAELFGSHRRARAEFAEAVAVVGQVLQSGGSPVDSPARGSLSGLNAALEFPFFSSRGDWIANVMAGNLSVKREAAIAAGGFDENFVGVAYRFEMEFARRLIERGGNIRYSPEASIHHLWEIRGGTRSTGSHLTSADPTYGVDDYYFALISDVPTSEKVAYMLRRPVREVCTRFHLQRPWYIPIKLTGEFRAALLAIRLSLRKFKGKTVNTGAPAKA